MELEERVMTAIGWCFLVLVVASVIYWLVMTAIEGPQPYTGGGEGAVGPDGPPFGGG